MGETIEALVDAGKASAGPPLGPSLGPTGVNVKDVVDEINSKTKEMAGMQVPVKIKIDDNKGFTYTNDVCDSGWCLNLKKDLTNNLTGKKYDCVKIPNSILPSKILAGFVLSILFLKSFTN